MRLNTVFKHFCALLTLIKKGNPKKKFENSYKGHRVFGLFSSLVPDYGAFFGLFKRPFGFSC